MSTIKGPLETEGLTLLRAIHENLASAHQTDMAIEQRLAALESATAKISLALETLFAWTASDDMRADWARRVQELDQPPSLTPFEAAEPEAGAGYRGAPAHLRKLSEPELSYCARCGAGVPASRTVLSSRGPICAVCAADAELGQ